VTPVDRCECIRAAFKRAGVEKPTQDQLDTACSQLDGFEAKHGPLKLPLVSKKEMAAEADKAVSFCLQAEAGGTK
jgi:hypothetical protein